jgi:hypothetical protein
MRWMARGGPSHDGDAGDVQKEGAAVVWPGKSVPKSASFHAGQEQTNFTTSACGVPVLRYVRGRKEGERDVHPPAARSSSSVTFVQQLRLREVRVGLLVRHLNSRRAAPTRDAGLIRQNVMGRARATSARMKCYEK